MYVVSGVVFAVPFDVKRQTPVGERVPVVEGVGVARSVELGFRGAQFSVSTSGALAYVTGPVDAFADSRLLALIAPDGMVAPLALPPNAYVAPRMSPGGRQIAVGIETGTQAEVWVGEVSGATSLRRLTFGGKNRYPIWSPDGQRIAYQSDREGDLGIFWQKADGTGSAERLTKPESGVEHRPESWSPDNERM